MQKVGSKYLGSKEIKKKLKITSCELMHLREGGKLKFIKKGNAYFYKKLPKDLMNKYALILSFHLRKHLEHKHVHNYLWEMNPCSQKYS